MTHRHDLNRASLVASVVAVIGAVAVPMTAMANDPYRLTVYSGSQCRPGTYGEQGTAVANNGYISLPQQIFCPVPRQQPTWTQVAVEVYLRNVNSPDGLADSGHVSCSLDVTNAAAQNTQSAGGTSDGISTGNAGPFLNLTITPLPGESLWSAMNATTPMWRHTRLRCEQLPAGFRLVNYVVTERP